jgi:CHAT domain
MPDISYLVVNAEGDGYIYTFCPQRNPPLSGGKTPADDVVDMESFLQDSYYTALRSAAEGNLTDTGASTYLLNLGGLGNHLYESVIPPELKAAVSRMKSGDFLHILADKCNIPWELVKNGGEFWGKFFVMSNSMMAERGRKDPELFTLNAKKILNVIGHGIDPSVAVRAKQLFQNLVGKVDVQLIDGGTDQDATLKVYEQLSTADIVHFTSHGEMGPAGAYLRIVKQKGSYANFMVTSIRQGSLRPGCIVFANACVSAGTEEVIGQSLGFGPSFCQYGASAFVGTLDFVPGKSAVLFAECFYNLLFSGHQVGKALWTAKQLPLKDKDTMSLVPLLYSLYGNPLCTVKLL